MYGAGYEKWSLERTTFEDLPHEILMDDRAIEGYFDSYEENVTRCSENMNRYNDPGYDWDRENW